MELNEEKVMIDEKGKQIIESYLNCLAEEEGGHMAISNYDLNKLRHDMKRATRAIKLIRDEENGEKRKLIADLLMEEMDRLSEDLEEIKDANGNGKE